MTKRIVQMILSDPSTRRLPSLWDTANHLPRNSSSNTEPWQYLSEVDNWLEGGLQQICVCYINPKPKNVLQQLPASANKQH